MFDVIQQELKRQNKSIYWLAKQLGTERQRIYQLAKQKDMRLSLAFRIADVLGIDVNKFRKEGINNESTRYF
ncbi:transcriptional regulator [Carnobacteriaceae bacterium zg-ZUI78]|nr:transcriptional regulator [Carnobacteriaceae bacterium zg-ZUI78]